MKRTTFAALLGAGLLTLGVLGSALAGSGPSDPQTITPVVHAGNIQLPGSHNDGDKAACGIADAVDIDGQDKDFTGDATTTNGVKVTITYAASSKTLSFTAAGGLVTVAYVKGGDAYNQYSYPGAGVANDGNLYAPINNGGQAAGLSHAIFCTTVASASATVLPTWTPSSQVEGETSPPQPPTDSLAGTAIAGPSDGAWLVVALGVLLASVLVLTPKRSGSKR